MEKNASFDLTHNVSNKKSTTQVYQVVIFYEGYIYQDVYRSYTQGLNYSIIVSDIVPFLATPLKGRFVVFSKWLQIGYFRLGQVMLGQVIVPPGQSPPQGLEIGEKLLLNTKKRPLRGVATNGTIPIVSYKDFNGILRCKTLEKLIMIIKITPFVD